MRRCLLGVNLGALDHNEGGTLIERFPLGVFAVDGDGEEGVVEAVAAREAEG